MAVIFNMANFCPSCQILSKLSDRFLIVRLLPNLLFPNCQIVSKFSDCFQILQIVRSCVVESESQQHDTRLPLSQINADRWRIEREREGGLSSNYHSSNIVQMYNTESSYSHHHCVQSVENGEQIYPSIRGPIAPKY